MKILYIGLKNDYGRPDRGYSFEHNNFYETLNNMESIDQLIYFPFDEVLREFGRDRMNEMLLEKAEEAKPDLCFFFLFTDEIKKETITTLRERGFITYNWFADDHWRFVNFSKKWAPLFSYFSTTDGKSFEKYKKMGLKNAIKTQWACNKRQYKKTGKELKYDITFVGQAHGNRRKLIDFIKSKGLRVSVWGSGWGGGRIDQEEMIKIFGESKINLNFTSSSGIWNKKAIAKIFLNRRADDTYQVYNPASWPANFMSWVNKGAEQIKGRNFEVPGSGGFLLTGDADNLSDYFEDGKEIVIFKDMKDLIEKAKYYLSHEDERAAIAEAGYIRTITDHTYENRFNKIFSEIGLIE